MHHCIQKTTDDCAVTIAVVCAYMIGQNVIGEVRYLFLACICL